MLSEDLKWRIIYYYEEGYKSKEIAKRLYVSKITITNICKIFDKWECVNDSFTRKLGKRKIFTSEDMQILQDIVQKKVDYYLDELIYKMEIKTGKLVSIPILCRSFQHCGIIRKKLQKVAHEQNETLRGFFMYQIGIEYNAEQLIFIDETSKDERSISRLYGYSYKNCRAKKKVIFIRGKHYTILPALTVDGFIAADIMEGSCDKDRFRTFIITQVVIIYL
ncbi:unnamed protein product [Rhizophagus irregularis]|nr:unnamed protein product [Rhizophagus irregularis]